MTSLLDRRITQFENFDHFDPSLTQFIHSSVDVEYFPRGNDQYLTELVESLKKIIIKNVNN